MRIRYIRRLTLRGSNCSSEASETAKTTSSAPKSTKKKTKREIVITYKNDLTCFVTNMKRIKIHHINR